MLPLAGITVIAVEQAVAAPFATRQLADLGARVIKIERPDGGDFARHYDETVRGMSSHFVWLNRSKESLTLDLKHPGAPNIMHQLLARADVFIQNLAPGASERLGLDAAALAKQYPRLICCSITGYGSTGPYRDKKAYDLLVQCETGLVSITGTPETPAKTGIPSADLAAGMYAFSGIVSALYQRERMGTGTVLEVSLFDALGEWMGYPAYFTAYGGQEPSRMGASHAAIAPYGPFRCADGQEIYVAVQNEREWQRFCEHVLDCADVATDPRFHTNSLRVTHRAALEAIIAGVFGRLPADEAMDRLDRIQIANARMNSIRAFWEHPQLAERNRWRSVNSPVGMLQALRPPVTQPGIEPRMDPIPALGEHTEAILAELGYDVAAILQLRDSGAI